MTAAAPQRQRLIALALTLGAAAAVLVLGGGYHAGFLTLNHASRVLPAPAWAVITHAGDSLSALSLLAVCAWRQPRLLWLALFAALIATALSHTLKPLIDALRPPAVLAVSDFQHIGPLLRRHSFPSGHAITAFTAASVLLWHSPSRLRALLMLSAASVVAFSRIAVGVHWPVDVLCGAALGILAVVAAAAIVRRLPVERHPRALQLWQLALALCCLWTLIQPAAYAEASLPAKLLAALGLAAMAMALRRRPAPPVGRGSAI